MGTVNKHTTITAIPNPNAASIFLDIAINVHIPRNTDNAWMETSVFHFHCSDQLGCRLQLCAGDDARAVKWMDVDGEGMQKEAYRAIYGNHRSLIERAVRRPRRR